MAKNLLAKAFLSSLIGSKTELSAKNMTYRYLKIDYRVLAIRSKPEAFVYLFSEDVSSELSVYSHHDKGIDVALVSEKLRLITQTL